MAASLTAAPALVRAVAKRTPIDVVMTQGLSGLTMHEIARAQGYFEEFNLEPKVLQVSDGAKCVAALISGSAHVCMGSGFSQLTPAIERGARLKILAGALNLPSLAMFSAKAEVKQLADLEGRIVGIGSLGSVLHQMTVFLLKKKGVNVAKVQFRNVGSNAEVLKSVIARTVDAGLSDVDVIDQQQKYGMHALPDGMLWKEIPEYTNQGAYASVDAINEDRDGLVRVLAAYGKAYRFVCGPGSKEAFVKARAKVTGSAEHAQAITLWNWIQQYQPYAKNLVLTPEQVNLVQRINIDFKSQRSMLPFASLADMSLANEALKAMDRAA